VHSDPEDALTTQDQIAARLNSGHNFAWICAPRHAAGGSRGEALNMKGIYSRRSFSAFIPTARSPAQVLGYVGVDDNGWAVLKKDST